jgi:branched-chain amino acid transport system ATP-binding protein
MALLRVEAVTKTFSGLTALDSVSLEVSGGIVGVIGPNGAGKTTLFNVIAGSAKPDTGRVLFNDADITGYPPHRIARMGLARTFQLMRPFYSMTVSSNIACSALAHNKSKSQAALVADGVIERVGLGAWKDAFPAQLPTAARKRLELARALALQPGFLLLDEVLAGLLPSEREPMIDLLKQLRAEGLVIMLVEHVMAAVMALSDEIVVLHHGELLASGPPEAVTGDPRVVDAYLGEEFLIAQA